jgi:hypothetical protein
VFADTSKIEMNWDATKYANTKMNTQGRVGSILIPVIGPSRKYPQRVVDIAITDLARNMKPSAIPSTKANLAEFLRIKRKL